MDEIKSIRKRYFEEGASIKKIGEETGRDRKTIRKYIDKGDWNIKKKAPKQSASKIDPYKPIIDKWLENDKQQRAKQRHTAKRIHKRLMQEYKDTGYDCSYRIIASYVSLKKSQIYSGKNGYLPLEHPPGEVQVDFGSADFIEHGTRYNGHYLTVSFPYSNAGFVQLFKGETFECLSEGLKNIYMHIGGVPHTQWFDNASSMVIKILKNHKRHLREPFIRFCEHYGFEAVFCNAYAGHEKGSVENKVGYLRRNLLVPVPEFDDIDIFNKSLLKMCEKDMMREHYKKNTNINTLFKEDCETFNPLSSTEFNCSVYTSVRTDKYGKFTLKGKHTYSTKPNLAGKMVTVELSASYVNILNEKMHQVAKHKRLYSNKRQESMDWIPYLSQLSKRPMALKYSGIYKMLPASICGWIDSCDYTNKKEALRLLAEITEKSGFDTAVNALEKTLEYGVFDTDSVKSFYKRLSIDNQLIEKLLLPLPVSDPKPINSDISAYDSFLSAKGTL